MPLSHPDYLDGLTPEEIIQLPKEEMEMLMGQTVQKMHLMDAKRKLNFDKPSGVIDSCVILQKVTWVFEEMTIEKNDVRIAI